MKELILKKIYTEKNEFISQNNRKKFEFIFKTTVPNEYNVPQEIDEKLEEFIKRAYHDNMLNNVMALKTILKEYQEEYLSIYNGYIENYEMVEYRNGQLETYAKVNNEKRNKIIRYNSKSGLSFELSSLNNLKMLNNLKDKDLLNDEVLEYIRSLNDIKPLNLSMEDEIIAKIYKLFYNENPNFMDEKIFIKIQTMMVILANYGINLGKDYEYRMTEFRNVELPMSINLEFQIDRLYPLGKVSIFNNAIKLSQHTIETIKIVGQTIREYAKNDSGIDYQKLINISKVMYGSYYDLPMDATEYEINKISEYSKCQLDETNSILVLGKRIKNNLENNEEVNK